MSGIDWSKAPEGATHHNSNPGRSWPWMKQTADGGWFFYHAERGEWLLQSDFPCMSDRPVERPAPWNGEGLPPVGAVCEYYWAADDSWRSGTCVAHFDGRAVICDVDDEDCAERLDAHHVRATRTPEQIAAEERERVVKEIRSMISGLNYEQAANIIYDAGYRKQESKP